MLKVICIKIRNTTGDMSSFLKAICILILINTFIFSQEKSVLKVIVKEGQGIREIAKEYLKDPDLWQEILWSNNLKSPTDLVPGMTLTIPYLSIMKVKNKVDEALFAIQLATNEGAKHLASDKINSAIESYNSSIEERKKGNWEKSFNFAETSKKYADEALKISITNRSSVSEATLTFLKGTVESKKVAEPSWKNALLLEKLVESDKLRTQKNSYAEIQFIDNSKIKLNDNSQVTIKKNRVDLIKNTTESSISVEKGDAFALLSGSGGGKKFNLNIPGVQTNIKSTSFWIKSDEKSVKVANYEGEIELSSKSSKVTIKKNQGSSVSSTGNITQPKILLASPKLFYPENNSILNTETVSFKWMKIKDAANYWLVIASDVSFKKIVFFTKNLKDTTLNDLKLNYGFYYWHVASEDKENFVGSFGETRTFTLGAKIKEPFLVINTPKENEIFKERIINIEGITEAKVNLFLNGKQINISKPEGNFKTTYQLKEGENILSFVAKDSFDISTKIDRKVFLTTDSIIIIKYDESLKTSRPKNFIVTGDVFTLRGATTANSSVSMVIFESDFKMKTNSDKDGNFLFTITKIISQAPVLVSVITPNGFTRQDTIYFEYYDKTAKLIFLPEISSITKDDNLILKGNVLNASKLLLNNNEIKIVNKSFEEKYQLYEGINVLNFMIVDESGFTSTMGREIFLDKNPPELIEYKINPKTLSNDGTFSIEVKAKDYAGLKRIAKINFEVKGKSYYEFIKFNKSSEKYEARISIIEKPNAEIILKSIFLEDELGNSKEYKIK